MQISLLFSPPPLFPQDDYFLPLESQAGDEGGELGAIGKGKLFSPGSPSSPRRAITRDLKKSRL